jgi:hypothetical protein
VVSPQGFDCVLLDNIILIQQAKTSHHLASPALFSFQPQPAWDKILLHSTKHSVKAKHHLMENHNKQQSTKWNRVADGHDIGFCQDSHWYTRGISFLVGCLSLQLV